MYTVRTDGRLAPVKWPLELYRAVLTCASRPSAREMVLLLNVTNYPTSGINDVSFFFPPPSLLNSKRRRCVIKIPDPPRALRPRADVRLTDRIRRARDFRDFKM